MRRLSGLVAAGLACAASGAVAHETGAHVAPWEAPLAGVLIGALALGFLAGLAAALSRTPRRWPVARWRVACFVLALATLAAALSAVVDELAAHRLSVHMAQHLLLVLVAAPLIAVSHAPIVFLHLLPLEARRRFGRAVARLPGWRAFGRHGAGAWLAAAAFMFAIALWHVPAAFGAALEHPLVHMAEHAILIGTAIAFWRVVLATGERRLTPGVAVMMLSLLGAQGAFMGAIIALTPHALYAAYAGNGPDDQALAGVIMCVPASLIYLGCTVWTLARMIGNERTRSPRARPDLGATGSR